MTPFDLINTDRWQGAPFSVPCPYCGAASTYIPSTSKFPCNHASWMAFELSGHGDEEGLRGTVYSCLIEPLMRSAIQCFKINPNIPMRNVVRNIVASVDEIQSATVIAEK